MTPRRKTVLVIDDSRMVLDLTQAALEGAGFAVAVAQDLTTFERERARVSPDLILVDVQMPEAFGDDVASTLRGAYGVKIPILLVSTLDEEELALRARGAGADGWVSKRNGLAELVRCVRARLDESQGA